ncbi:3-deoxy-7-phosphoheptulonate synthase [Streptomyces sp. RO-S4]|uniref:3-deoxy-7-phosphoheptulonate synthase n=1 Tax=Streptomyces sp. RO-S4 TaxID=2902486 RepID=UPI00208EEF50|nr:3-deoxy-7-phosphoheptulonate synthase [Streptomyces sp. RO-S4]
MNATSLRNAQSSARQQPPWEDLSEVERVRNMLAELPGLVDPASLDRLRNRLAAVAAGQALVVQAGDCAEDFAECTAGDVKRRADLLDVLAGVMNEITHRPVIKVGRIGGQYAKPRSATTETVAGVELPVYRGHMVNGAEPDPEARRPDPRRLLTGYHAAHQVFAHLCPTPRDRVDPAVWTSHEALLLDYEVPMVRADREGRLALTSTHWPWIGERTRQPDGAHVALLSEVVNPVACKIGPRTTTTELLGLCARLDPARTPGRLTLIARMGAGAAAELLPPLVRAVRTAGHPVIWLADPMHGNTVTTAEGRKTRVVETVVREVTAFQDAVRSAGATPGGIHLETTPDAVTECADVPEATDHIGDKYTSLCDPRLNPRQAISVVSAWQPQSTTNRAEGESCRA